MKIAKAHTNSVRKTVLKLVLTVVSVMILFVVGAFSSSALSEVQEAAIKSADNSLTVEAMGIGYDLVTLSRRKSATNANRASSFRTDRQLALALTDEEITEIAKQFADKAMIMRITLPDGHETYTVTVDFRTEDSLYYFNPLVVRAVSLELIEKVAELSEKRNSTQDLMDYTHVVGELSVHFLGYRITMKLGGETSNGPIGYWYDKFSIADLNVDEDRFSLLIRMAGIIVG